MSMYDATREEMDAWEDRLDILEEALFHLEAALSCLEQPFATDETVILGDLINMLSVEKHRLEMYLQCDDLDE